MPSGAGMSASASTMTKMEPWPPQPRESTSLPTSGTCWQTTWRYLLFSRRGVAGRGAGYLWKAGGAAERAGWAKGSLVSRPAKADVHAHVCFFVCLPACQVQPYCLLHHPLSLSLPRPLTILVMLLQSLSSALESRDESGSLDLGGNRRAGPSNYGGAGVNSNSREVRGLAPDRVNSYTYQRQECKW